VKEVRGAKGIVGYARLWGGLRGGGLIAGARSENL